MNVRHIEERDWDDIVALEKETYARGLSENPAALRSKNAASPSTCFVFEDAGQVVGYVLALPYPQFECPQLAEPERTVYRSRNLHVHDLVIAERCRGRGLAKRLLQQVTRSAEQDGYPCMSLVAVAGSSSFWQAQGFVACSAVELPSGYGEDAVYMSRTEQPSHMSGERGTRREE